MKLYTTFTLAILFLAPAAPALDVCVSTKGKIRGETAKKPCKEGKETATGFGLATDVSSNTSDIDAQQMALLEAQAALVALEARIALIQATTQALITTQAVAALWAPYKTTTATCEDAVKVAIGESGLTTDIPGSPQKGCEGACINPNAFNPSGATGIWQIKCPDPSHTGTYNAFLDAGLIVNGSCVDLTNEQNNALAASLIVEVACPPGRDFCPSQWTGGAGYYDQFSDAAATACAPSSD